MNKLDGLLPRLTHEQLSKFYRIFPDGVSSKKMKDAISLVERTLKNDGVPLSEDSISNKPNTVEKVPKGFSTDMACTEEVFF